MKGVWKDRSRERMIGRGSLVRQGKVGLKKLRRLGYRKMMEEYVEGANLFLLSWGKLLS